MSFAPLESIASAAGKLLSAVTTQMGEYAQAGRFKAQSIIPAAAFLLGCLAIAMSLMEPSRPREWWSTLSYDVKLLLLALSGILLILVSELGRQMGLLLRQFYSGEWPSSFWAPFRIHYLQKQEDYRNLRDALIIADNELRRTETKIDSFRPQLTGPKKLIQVPMLQVPIDAYQLIEPGLVVMVETEETGVESAIRDPGDLIGRYTMKALPANTPVNKEQLGTAPRLEFFQNTRVMPLKVPESDMIKQLEPGSVVSLIIRNSNLTKSYTSLLVLDQLQADVVVLSVPETHVPALLADLSVPDAYNATLSTTPILSLDFKRISGGQAKLSFTLDPTPEKEYLIGLPVSKTSIRPGQIIRLEDHISWKMDSLRSAKDSETQLAKIVGTVYWPAHTGPSAPDQRVEDLDKGKPFKKKFLHPLLAKIVGTVYWLAHTGPSAPDQKVEDLDKGKPFKKKFLQPLPEESWLSATDEGGQSKIRDFVKLKIETKVPIRVGDRLRIYDKTGKLLDRFCYVIELTPTDSSPDTKQYECYMAVSKKPSSLSEVYTADPYDDIPVLKEEKKAGELLKKADLQTMKLRAGDAETLRGILLEDREIENRYVLGKVKTLPPKTPISQDQVAPATKHPKKITLDSSWCQLAYGSAVGAKPGRRLCRGDLVSVNLAGQVSWNNALVYDVVLTENAEISRWELSIPQDKFELASPIINTAKKQPKVRCEITITYDAADFEKRLRQFKKSVNRQQNMHDINQIISGVIKKPGWIENKVKQVCELVDEMQSTYEKFKERPWLADRDEAFSPYTYEEEFKECFFNHAKTATLWRESIRKLKNTQERGKELALPRAIPETRATALGNVLAAAAEYPEHAYNIDTSSALPRLLLALGDDHRAVKRLQAANDNLSMLLLVSFWSALWTVLGLLTYLAAYFYDEPGPWWFLLLLAPGGLILSWLANEAAVSQAYAYGEEIKVLFDTERFALFESMGIVVKEGEQITSELEREYWKQFFQLYAFGNMKNFPPVKLPDAVKTVAADKEAKKQ